RIRTVCSRIRSAGVRENGNSKRCATAPATPDEAAEATAKSAYFDLYSIVMRVKSWNQLCALTKPLTRLVIARGLRSCTINSQAASSTITSCAWRMPAAISSGSVDFSIFSTVASNSAFFQFAQLNPFGGNVLDRKNVVKRENSVPWARL